LRHFAGIERLREAGIEELSQLAFLDKKTASLVHDFFHREKSGEL
jgi:hypothetical protein